MKKVRTFIPISHRCTELEESFPLSVNVKRCLQFIIDKWKKTSFHSPPSNSVH